ncbi:MAG TPA: curlin, partial [Oxalobacteraceae bacterium]|nr:curlin [Oxalobacteraceae bacterium]
TAYSTQTGPTGDVSITQSLDWNQAYVTQINYGSGLNTAGVLQSGSSNLANVTQNGNSFTASVAQGGNGNVATVWQHF